MKDSPNTIKILLAEDSAIIREHINMVLSFERNFKVIGQVGSGREAVEFVKIQQPDVILMDIEMEEKSDGISAASEILSLYSDIKIIMLTVQEEEDRILSAYAAGACDYILKGGSAKEIIEAIDAAYNNCSPIRPIIANKVRKQLKNVKNIKQNLYEIINIVTQLTPTEISILKYVLEGKKQIEISKAKHIELSTVKTHIQHLLKKFKVDRTSEMIRILKENDIEKILKL